MPDPYESELIGCFLVALGFSAAKKGKEEPIFVNCLQQSPWDALRGDMMVGCTSFLALEFKRYLKSKQKKAERQKWDRDGLLKNFLDNPHLIAPANEYHLVVYGDDKGLGQIRGQPFLPVLLHLKRPKSETERSNPEKWDPELDINPSEEVSLREILSRILDERIGNGSAMDVSRYLDSIERYRKNISKEESSEGSSESGGSGGPALLAVLWNDDGQVVVANPRELKLLLQEALKEKNTNTLGNNDIPAENPEPDNPSDPPQEAHTPRPTTPTIKFKKAKM